MDSQTAARVLAFLSAEAATKPNMAAVRQSPEPYPARLATAPTIQSARRTGLIEFELFGQSRRARTAIDAVVEILSEIAGRFPGTLERVSAAVASRSRRYIAPNRAALIPGRSDLAARALEFAPGWFVDANVANRDKQVIIEKACAAVGLTFGCDVKLCLPNSKHNAPD